MAETQYEVDLGNLLAFDAHHQFASPPSSREEIVNEALEQGTKLVQAVADALFNLPSTEDLEGPIVKLPAPTSKLPEKSQRDVLARNHDIHLYNAFYPNIDGYMKLKRWSLYLQLPKPRPPTKWEVFAQKKGIQKRNKEKLVFDEQTGSWSAAMVMIVLMMTTTYQSLRPRPLMKAGALPSHIQLAATSLPITGTQTMPKKVSKDELQNVAEWQQLQQPAGKFDKKLPGENPQSMKKKYRKVSLL
ncbi:hypothetical protein DH2020_015000 [Rehmannia glutinosa]|uniref:Ribosome biogenesis regulatory protein n=1 Tax=Rehmannia glutinosa TaxID=99300 RepID=A0ABR0X1Q8_REHGL